MPATLNSLTNALSIDPGLNANVTTADRLLGVEAAAQLNALILQVVSAYGLNADGRITAADLQVISDRVQADPGLNQAFLAAHGDDEWQIETGFHLLQNDGGTLMFQGRKFVDTVADAIYHFGFDITDGRYVNEDGNANELADDVAGWLNWFLNGENAVYGTAASEQLNSGTYSEQFAAARNESFYGGGGDDSIWADLGNDRIYGGDGNDRSGGGAGDDAMYGEMGNDTLYGESGNDTVMGGDGQDVLGGGDGQDFMGGGAGNDTVYGNDGADYVAGGLGHDVVGGGLGNDTVEGGDGNDTVYGDAGDDLLRGGSGNDQIHAGDGNDVIGAGDGNDLVYGGNGADYIAGHGGDDTLSGGNGADTIRADGGRDLITLWEDFSSVDVLDFRLGDSGRTRDTIDRVEGFESGVDRIYLGAMGPMSFEDIDFVGGGKASCFYDGTYLRIDANGDRATDMMVEFAWVNSLQAGDLILG